MLVSSIFRPRIRDETILAAINAAHCPLIEETFHVAEE